MAQDTGGYETPLNRLARSGSMPDSPYFSAQDQALAPLEGESGMVKRTELWRIVVRFDDGAERTLQLDYPRSSSPATGSGSRRTRSASRHDRRRGRPSTPRCSTSQGPARLGPRYYYRRFFDDAQALERFVAEVVAPDGSSEMDAGKPAARRSPSGSALPGARRADRALERGWPLMLKGEIAGTAAIGANSRARHAALCPHQLFRRDLPARAQAHPRSRISPTS